MRPRITQADLPHGGYIALKRVFVDTGNGKNFIFNSLEVHAVIHEQLG